jgi:hypothetical protein
MPAKTLPPGWPDPYTLLRDLNWEENYPKLLLRGIYSIMERAPGDVESKYKAGFNIALYKLTTAQPPRFQPAQVKKGILTMETLTSVGREKEAEVTGLRDLSPASRRKYGKTTSRSEMKRDTAEKMKKLGRLLEMVRATTAEEGMPTGGSA